MRLCCVQMKEHTWPKTVDGNQLRRKIPLQLAQSPACSDQLIYSAVGICSPKWKAMNRNPVIVVFQRKIGRVLSRHHDDLTTAFPQGQKKLRGEHFCAAYDGPKQFGPE